MLDILEKCQQPAYRPLNKGAEFASSMLANGGLDAFQTHAKSSNDEVKRLATVLMEKTVPMIWQ